MKTYSLLRIDVLREKFPRVVISTRIATKGHDRPKRGSGRRKMNPPTYAIVVDGILMNSYLSKARAREWCRKFLAPIKEAEKEMKAMEKWAQRQDVDGPPNPRLKMQRIKSVNMEMEHG